MILTALITVIGAYLIGSVNFAVIFTRAFKKVDIRTQGSGNAGTTNVMRVGGFLPGALTFVCDALKGFVACMLGKVMFEYISTQQAAWWTAPFVGAYICGVACMTGHIFPLFFGFKGGKGVATSVGIFAICSPVAIVIGLAVFAVVTLVSKYVSLGSLVATVTVVVLAVILRHEDAPFAVQAISCAVMGALIYYKHIGNIKRLIAGNENKIKSRR